MNYSLPLKAKSTEDRGARDFALADSVLTFAVKQDVIYTYQANTVMNLFCLSRWTFFFLMKYFVNVQKSGGNFPTFKPDKVPQRGLKHELSSPVNINIHVFKNSLLDDGLLDSQACSNAVR